MPNETKDPLDLNGDGYVSPAEEWEAVGIGTPKQWEKWEERVTETDSERKAREAAERKQRKTNQIPKARYVDAQQYLQASNLTASLMQGVMKQGDVGGWRVVDNNLVFVPAQVDGKVNTAGTPGLALIAQDADRTKWFSSSIDPNAPADVSDFTEQYFLKLGKTPNGVASLRDMLIDKNILTGESAVMSKQMASANPNSADFYLRTKVSELVALASFENYNRTVVAGEKTLLTFDEYINKLAKATTGNGSGGMGGTRTTITRQDFQADDYREALDQMFMEYSGRGASERELNSFINTLQKMEAKNPQKTVDTTKGNTTVRKQTGGISQDAAMSEMKQQALADPNAENYNKATKFLDMFMDSLGTDIELGA